MPDKPKAPGGKTEPPAKKAEKKAGKSKSAQDRGTTKKSPVPNETVPAATRAGRKKRSGGRTPSAIVGIGASAGGVQALESFFAHMPSDTGISFVIVQHLDPHHESLMNSLLTKQTTLPVNDIRDGMPVDAGQVYLKPPGWDVVIRHRTLYLQEPENREMSRMPIDTFFRSLAEDVKEKACAIVLSGANTDGTLGAKQIKGEGGLVMVQDENQAEYQVMPRSVIDAGLADMILPVEKMPDELGRYVKHPFIAGAKEEAKEDIQQILDSILMVVRTNTGHDFSEYKQNTILRRIERRLALHQLENMVDYRRFLRRNPEEVIGLFRDLTINVTSFFRDADFFQSLKENAIRHRLESMRSNEPFRIWVAGCATGEEAYSIGILMVEILSELDQYREVKIFATDINDDAVEFARYGMYPENISADISPERLKRFFTKKGQRFQVDGRLRDMMVFASHDVIRDPPFSDVDLISCRNMLIYMDAALQKRVLPVFHYALKPEGILFLGSSEALGDASKLFEIVDKHRKIFTSKDVQGDGVHHVRMPAGLLSGLREPVSGKIPEPAIQAGVKSADIKALAEQTLLEKYAPPAVLLNEAGEIIYVLGDAGRYLCLPSGPPSFNIFEMVGGNLHLKLSQGLANVMRDKEPYRISGVQIRYNDEFLSLEVILSPVRLKNQKVNWILVEFKEAPRAKPRAGKASSSKNTKDPKIDDLERTLNITRQELQATIEELETSNEELKSANEELQANNEELQSANEEMESSREELQSTNEELETVNAELSKKNQDLMQVEDDLNNLFVSTEIATIFLNDDLHIKRFTPQAKEVFNLQEERDLGRPISDITSQLEYDRLHQDAAKVLNTLERKEIEVKNRDGKKYLTRIIPYRTSGNIIQGVVITFLDVSRLAPSRAQEGDAGSLFSNAAAALWEPILLLDEDLKVQMANRAFYRAFKTSPRGTENRSIFELGDGQWNIAELRRFLEEIIPADREFEGYEVEHAFPAIGVRKMAVSGRKIEKGEGRPAMILLGFKDIT